MSLDMICISKRAINFHPSISIKANGITSHYSGQPRSVTSSYKYAAPKKDEKEEYGRKHQESIRESYYDGDSNDLQAGICANPQKGALCMNRMIDLSD